MAGLLRLRIGGVAALLVLFAPALSTQGQTLEERELGQYVDRLKSAETYLLVDPDVEARINEIGRKLVAHSSKPEMQYTFRVVNLPIINAAAAPAGYIFINTGLLDIIESEDELAAILGHEIAHAANSHTIDAVYDAHAKAERGRWGGIALGALFGVALGSVGQSAGASTQQVGQAMDLGFQLGGVVSQSITNAMILGYGREKELEADSVGLELATAAGYDPYAFVRVLRRMDSVRIERGLTRENYQSALINAEPGIEARIAEATRRIGSSEEKR